MIELMKLLKCLVKAFLGVLGLVIALALIYVPFLIINDNFGPGWAFLSLFVAITIELGALAYWLERKN